MTITLRVSGTPTGTTDAVTAVNPAVGAGATTGDISILMVAAKPYSTVITTPTGWTKIGEATNGTVASGIDVGSTICAAYYQVSAPVGAIGAIGQSGADSMGGVINTFFTTQGGWDLTSWTSGGDTTQGADYAATGAAGINVATGDRVITLTALNTDNGSLSGAVIAGMAGATISDHLGRSNFGVTTGNDIRSYIRDVAISAGSSNAAPTMAFTNATSSSGTTIFLRIREVAANPPVLGMQAVSQAANW